MELSHKTYKIQKDVKGLFGQYGFDLTVEKLVAELRPAIPLYVLQGEALKDNARRFTRLFPGEVMYAVKCNPEKEVVQTLYRSGIASFDVASIDEVRMVRKYAPKAKLYFMHPVKSGEAISEAYFDHGVRTFVLDAQEELYKILRATEFAADLDLFVRIALPKNDTAKIDFASKFGAEREQAVALLQQARNVSSSLGVCFHVGSQAMDPAAYDRAIRYAAGVIKDSGVRVDMLDVGGGFPVPYADEVPQDLAVYMQTITESVQACGLGHMKLLAEPGRAMVAAGSSLIVRVERRRGDVLYINDGVYGGLFDAGPWLNTRYPVKLLRDSEDSAASGVTAFRFAGPTCDSLDMMEGPFYLPDDIREGDWIEIQNTGAYSACFHGGNFNGMGRSLTVSVSCKDAVKNTTAKNGRKKQ